MDETMKFTKSHELFRHMHISLPCTINEQGLINVVINFMTSLSLE